MCKAITDSPTCNCDDCEPAGSMDEPAPVVRAPYPAWTASYSNEDFDRVQGLAQQLTDQDRAAGRYPAGYGYGRTQVDEARKIVGDANRYSAAYHAAYPWKRGT